MQQAKKLIEITNAIMYTLLIHYTKAEDNTVEEKRQAKRIQVELNLKISSLFMQDNVKVENINAPINVVDISRGGIGFITESILPLGYYFNATLNLGDEDDAALYCVVKIIRTKDLEDGMHLYGCEMTGLAPVLSYIFENYEKKIAAAEDAENNAPTK